MGKEIVIFDSTLRDGAQGEGISFSVEDKLNITVALDKLGISYIEAGNPASNPKDIEFLNGHSCFHSGIPELQHLVLPGAKISLWNKMKDAWRY